MRDLMLPTLIRDLVLQWVEITVFTQSLCHRFDQFLTNISPEGMQKLIAKSPTWFSNYDLPYFEVLSGFYENEITWGEDDLDVDAQQDDPLGLGLIFQRLKEQASPLSAKMQEKPDSPYELESDLTLEDFDKAGQYLSKIRVIANNARSLAVYGQTINEFIKAGLNGNDEGFIRAARMDSTIEGHPAVASRMAKANLNPHDGFAKELHAAVTKGPHKGVAKDHHQLRIALYFLHYLGILQQLSDEKRYRLLCEDLSLYDTSGRDPKAGLCTFINRWEESLIV